MTISTFLRSTIAVGPNRSRMLMIPRPRISMWCRVTSSPVPRTVSGPRFSRWMTSAETNRCPVDAGGLGEQPFEVPQDLVDEIRSGQIRDEQGNPPALRRFDHPGGGAESTSRDGACHRP